MTKFDRNAFHREESGMMIENTAVVLDASAAMIFRGFHSARLRPTHAKELDWSVVPAPRPKDAS